MAKGGSLLKPRMDRDDTIFALSSGRPPAAIAVVRLCGPRAGDALRMLAGRVPNPRVAALTNIRDPGTGEVIDQALMLWFPGPASETGEDMAELQLHGGRAVIAAVLGALGRIEGLRLAEPGEFARRAFEHGRIDLTRVEALADLIYADTQAQRRQAWWQLRGLLSEIAPKPPPHPDRGDGLIEAGSTFRTRRRARRVDPTGTQLPSRNYLMKLIKVSQAETAANACEGSVVAIAGPPNVGKSSLLNRIARRDAAIVSPIPGNDTRRHRSRSRLDGYPGHLARHRRHPRQLGSNRTGRRPACAAQRTPT
jgi:tRNA modification GTPase